MLMPSPAARLLNKPPGKGSPDEFRSPRRTSLICSPPGSPTGGEMPLLEAQWGSELEHLGVLDKKMAIFNLANIIMGVGVLSIPFALKQSGYFALLLVVFVILVTTKTAKWIGS